MSEFNACTFCHRQALMVEALKEERRRDKEEIRRLRTKNAKLRARLNWQPPSAEAA
jgi:hypothetical protein